MKLSKSILVTILYLILLTIISFWILLIPRNFEPLQILKATHLINSSLALIAVVIIFKLNRHDDVLVFNKTKNKFYLFAILLGIGFVYFQSLLNIIYYQKFSSDLFQYSFTFDKLNSLNTIASVLIVPITEELLFRSYIQRKLTKNYSPYLAIILSGLLFASIHIPLHSFFFEFMDFSFHQAYIALFGGLISGILFWKSKSIIPSLLFHMFWNLSSYIL